jgi:hypothetical protein
MDARVKPAHDDRGSCEPVYINKSIRCGISGMSAGGIG